MFNKKTKNKLNNQRFKKPWHEPHVAGHASITKDPSLVVALRLLHELA
jgi:hypothetical protein